MSKAKAKIEDVEPQEIVPVKPVLPPATLDEDTVTVEDSVPGVIPLTSEIEKCRRCVVYDGMGINDVAKKFNVTVTTVKKWAEVGKWKIERNIVTSGHAEAIQEALIRFSASREMPLANMYYQLQESAIKRLSEILDREKISVGTIDSILEIAAKGMSLGERVLNRSNPKKATELAASGEINVPGSGTRVQVNVLSALDDASRTRMKNCGE
jgi:hypothetical protein